MEKEIASKTQEQGFKEITRDDVLDVVSPKSKSSTFVVWSIFFVLLFGGITYYFLPKEFQVTYEVVKPSVGEISDSVLATGTLSAIKEVQVGSQVSGIISGVFVDVNDKVKKGQILAKINPDKLIQELDRNKARLRSAKASLESSNIVFLQKKWSYERLLNLYKKTKGKSPSELDLHNAKSEYDVARSELELKKANIDEIQTNIKASQIDIDFATITSPIDGVVLVKSIDVGQTVAASYQAPELFKIAQDLSKMELKISISESDVGKIKIGQEVSFRVDAYPNKNFVASISKIDFGSTVIDNVVSYQAKMYVDNSKMLLRPGMSATASVVVSSVKKAVIVPIGALYFAPDGESVGGESVWVLGNDNVLKKVKVKRGISNGKYVQVSGVDTDAMVVVGSTKKTSLKPRGMF